MTQLLEPPMPHDPQFSGLQTDLYELTMAAGYRKAGFDALATFELFVRGLPARRNFLVAAGLAQALGYLERVNFSQDEIGYLRRHPMFADIEDEFFDFLANFRFSGDVWAVPEGTVFFPDEPILRVTAPIAEAQIVETYLLSAIHFQTLIASKAARVVLAAAGRRVVEFGSRRAHGPDAGVLAARAAFIGGCGGTSNVAAGFRFGVPTFGTQAHSWIMAFEDEKEAFGRFLDIFPKNAVLLLDTYDVHSALETILAMGRKPRGVRLDSGDVVAQSIWIRRRLDEARWNDVEIFASGDLDEDRISAMLAAGARLNAFGVGTALATSIDAPALSVIYKLVEVETGGTVREAAKFSAAKVTYPGRKQVFRRSDARGKFAGDVIALEGEKVSGAEPLLEPVMRTGRVIAPQGDLVAAQRRCLEQVGRLPDALRGLAPCPAYPVRHSERLVELLDEVRRRVERAAR
jgi:nicotinate phosphoribosyltransferase